MSMYSRLGGNLMNWTHMPKKFSSMGVDVKRKPSVTAPLHYSGKYYDRELRFDESIFGLCPSPCDVRPCNVLVFELYEMGGEGESEGKDDVVAWAVLPMCDQHFRIVKGR